MTVAQFRNMARAFPGAEERAHHGHPDFRVSGKVFATLGYPDKGHGALMLTPEQQQAHMQAAPLCFAPAAGAWGRAGSTVVCLKYAHPELVGGAMTEAWQNVAPKAAVKKPRARAVKRRVRT